MSGFRPGDRYVEINGVQTRLRLSLSALAEMASELNASSPEGLALRIRSASLSDWNRILRAVATPRPEISLAENDLEGLLPILTSVISEGLGS